MKKVGILLLTGTLLLCSCGQAKETAENSADVPETIQTNLTANPYFDISDLTYDGTETQNIAIGYSFEDPADNDPVLTYDRYLSADGETFCFDADGRLCKYEKGDADTAEKAESGSMTAAYTMAQRQQRSLDVAESLLAEDTQLEVSSFGSEYLVTNDAVTPENEAPFSAIVDVDSKGEVRQLSVSYNTLSAPIDYDYFQQKLDAYIEEAKQTWAIVDYTVEPRYQQIGNKIYAMYTVTFTEATDEPEGANFCECVGFTQKIES